MLVGKEFSIKCEKILIEAERISHQSGVDFISVEEINKVLNFDRVEIKHLFQFLAEMNYLTIESIGGSYLYGDVSLTEKGFLKINSIKKKNS